MGKFGYDDIESFVEEHLEHFLKYHLDRGYSRSSIKKALLKFGYSSKELDKIIQNIKIEPKKIDKKYSKKELEGEAYYYLRGTLANYIKKQMEHGFDIEDIKEALINYGHLRPIVEDAAELVRLRKVNISHQMVLSISIAFIVLFEFIMGITLDTGFGPMFLVFSPSLASLIIASIFIGWLHKYKELIPMIFVVVTIALFMFIFPTLNMIDADSGVLLVVNTVIAFLATYFYSSLYVPRRKR